MPKDIQKLLERNLGAAYTLYGIVTTPRVWVMWQERSTGEPRCSTCWKNHKKTDLMFILCPEMIKIYFVFRVNARNQISGTKFLCSKCQGTLEELLKNDVI